MIFLFFYSNGWQLDIVINYILGVSTQNLRELWLDIFYKYHLTVANLRTGH